ncbi:hypothetical protein [Ralstonia solanacearum]|uniref:hypothetical protein n=1 Tax=Ralstonia solanacearum TaxID=305 RepID=UPI0013C2E866|nr:hypothetical protein [Ralstonia solanacearum]
MEIEIELTSFYSSGDESRFFKGLEEISAIKGFAGSGRGLRVSLDMRSLGQESLRDLIALLWRYQISLEPLALLAQRKKFIWLQDKRSYWHKSMFGEN